MAIFHGGGLSGSTLLYFCYFLGVFHGPLTIAPVIVKCITVVVEPSNIICRRGLESSQGNQPLTIKANNYQAQMVGHYLCMIHGQKCYNMKISLN